MEEGRTSKFPFEGLIKRMFSMGDSRFFFEAGVVGRRARVLGGGGGGKVRV